MSLAALNPSGRRVAARPATAVAGLLGTRKGPPMGAFSRAVLGPVFGALLGAFVGFGALAPAWANPALNPAVNPGLRPAAPAASAPTPTPAAARKVLRVAFASAETGFDPAQVSDLYSRVVTAHIFETPFGYDPLHKPAKLRPVTAEAMPEVSADYRVYTFRIKPGIYFADDPAFKGKKRELTAEDTVYTLKRTADPKIKAQIWGGVSTLGIVGLNEYRKALTDGKLRFDPAYPIEGLKALDRYTVRIQMTEPKPRMLQVLSSDQLGTVAREVVEAYGDKIMAHPVGTGPFRLKSWRRSSEIVLERNPSFREMRYDGTPAPGDTEAAALLARFGGRLLPMIDEVRVAIIEEEQPRWLSFLNGQIDGMITQAGGVPGNYVALAMPNGEIAPHLQRLGVQGRQQVNSDVGFLVFNMEDPVVGGYTPERVALRRAIGLAYDLHAEIRVIRKGQAIPGDSVIVPNTTGFDPAFKSEMSDHDPARAAALLDLYGYLDRNGDGWREQPDGSPLVLQRATQPEQIYRQFDELFRKNMQAVGLKVNFIPGPFAEHLKALRAAKLQMWSLASSADAPDGVNGLNRIFSPQKGQQNLAHFKNDEVDALYRQLASMPDGPEREALFLRAKMIAAAYAPYKILGHRISTDIWYPHLLGYRRPLFWQEWWHRVDLDETLRPKR